MCVAVPQRRKESGHIRVPGPRHAGRSGRRVQTWRASCLPRFHTRGSSSRAPAPPRNYHAETRCPRGTKCPR
eukprot:7787951-Alexandrium_andersonii.AAC.1